MTTPSFGTFVTHSWLVLAMINLCTKNEVFVPPKDRKKDAKFTTGMIWDA